MAVKIRLSRVGKKKAPFYRIVAVDSRKKRDGAYLENLGTYDGLKGVILNLDLDRVDYWISQGAIVSDTVKKLVKMQNQSAAQKSVGDKSKVKVKKEKTPKKSVETKKTETKKEAEKKEVVKETVKKDV